MGDDLESKRIFPVMFFVDEDETGATERLMWRTGSLVFRLAGPVVEE